jgi:quinoprotein glucose dehydrogenase
VKIALPRLAAVLTATALCFAAAPRHAAADDTADAQDGAQPPPDAHAARQRRAGTANSIWDGVFTAAQAQRGAAAYTGPCSHCHGHALNGAPDDPDMYSTPPLAGAKFLRDWDGQSLAALFEYMRTTMPENNPSYLSAAEYADIVAYMLSSSGVPAGNHELEGDLNSLARIAIQQRP